MIPDKEKTPSAASADIETQCVPSKPTGTDQYPTPFTIQEEFMGGITEAKIRIHAGGAIGVFAQLSDDISQLLLTLLLCHISPSLRYLGTLFDWEKMNRHLHSFRDDPPFILVCLIISFRVVLKKYFLTFRK